MRAHPNEIVVLWLSKHGSVCSKGNDQYPNTPVDTKQAFWGEIQELFQGLMVDFSQTKINTTSLKEMIARNHRAVFFMSDYAEFTNNSSMALDACLIDNRLGPSVDKEEEALAWERDLFANSTTYKQRIQSDQGFLLMSMATGVPSSQMVGAASLRFLHPDGKGATKACSDSFNIPGMTNWCPASLADITMLENYYKQLSLEECTHKFQQGWSFPNAIYINGIDVDGKIRIGTQVWWGVNRASYSSHALTGYGYVDALVYYNVWLGCGDQPNQYDHHCRSLYDKLAKRRTGVTRWEDPELGRLTTWPPL
jgi:hypothetical protein